MVLSAREDDNHGRKRGGNKTEVDLHVREHDKPAVTVTLFELAGALGASHTAGGVFSAAISSTFSTCPELRYAYPMPIPNRKRHAVRAASIPFIVPPPYAPALRAAKTNRMIVEAIKLHFRE